jgi:uroporphyrinogen-III synthase
LKRLVVLRPEPGASVSEARAKALGIDPILCPLFAVEPLAWDSPDPARYDALLLTSANALRHGGPGLAALAALPVVAVGEATAEAARAAGFAVTEVGTGGVDALLAALQDQPRLLHLAGADHAKAAASHRVHVVPIYCAVPIPAPPLPDLAGAVVAVHSARAGARLAELARDRSKTVIAAISATAAAACGTGWAALEAADHPNDGALLALAARLCQE